MADNNRQLWECRTPIDGPQPCWDKIRHIITCATCTARCAADDTAEEEGFDEVVIEGFFGR